MMKRFIAMLECAVLAGMLVCVSPVLPDQQADAQWQVPSGCVPIGRGAGTGFLDGCENAGSIGEFTFGSGDDKDKILSYGQPLIYLPNLPTDPNTFTNLFIGTNPTLVRFTKSASVSVASPAVVTSTAHGFLPGESIGLRVTGGALPTGVSEHTQYCVLTAGHATDSFRITATLGAGCESGTAINTTGTSTGTQFVGSWLDARYNITVGPRAGTDLRAGRYNALGAFEAGEKVRDGSFITAWGEASCFGMVDGVGTSCFGWKAGLSYPGNYGLFGGYAAGIAVDAGANCMVWGPNTATDLKTCNSSTVLGGFQMTGATLTNEIRISDGDGTLGFRMDSSRDIHLSDGATGRTVYLYRATSSNYAGFITDSSGNLFAKLGLTVPAAAGGWLADGGFRLTDGNALATNAIVKFALAPGMPGTASGTPTNASAGAIPFVFDTSNNRCQWYSGSWRQCAMVADIGATIQGYDSDLAALAALSSTGLAARTGSGTWAVRSIAGTANEITATNGDGVSGNPTLSLPTALTFTGKTVTGGTYSAIAGLTASGAVTPTSNDGAALGSTSLSWADLFLASGGVINWNNGAMTLEQSGAATLTATAATFSVNYSQDANTQISAVNQNPGASASASLIVGSSFGNFIFQQYSAAAGGSTNLTVPTDGHIYFDMPGSTGGTFTVRATNSFTTLFDITPTGIITMPANVSSTTTGTGTLVVTGGVGLSQNLNVGGTAAIGSSLSTTTFASIGTKIRAAGSAPAVSSCGTTPSISGSDLAGLVTTGTGTPTSCTITFNAAYASEPYCVVRGKVQAQVTDYTVSTTAIVVTTTATNNVPIIYHCIARSAGWLLKRDLEPAANDNTPAFMENAA